MTADGAKSSDALPVMSSIYSPVFLTAKDVAAFIAMPTKTASTSNIERQISLFFMGSSEKGEDLHPPPMRC